MELYKIGIITTKMQISTYKTVVDIVQLVVWLSAKPINFAVVVDKNCNI